MPYARTEDKLVREWAIPGTPGLEHRIGGLEKMNITGTVSYVPENHQIMSDIREEKINKIANFIPELEIEGDKSSDTLVIGWGGTYGHLYTAVDELNESGKSVALAHFNYINPLPRNTADVFSKFKNLIVCEINLGQFVNYLKIKHQDFKYEQINKVMGLPFTVIELKEKIVKIMEA